MKKADDQNLGGRRIKLEIDGIWIAAQFHFLDSGPFFDMCKPLRVGFQFFEVIQIVIEETVASRF